MSAPRGREAAPAVDRPAVGVGAVLIHEGKVLLIRRGKEPLRGRWVVPGGTVEVGETLEEALVREIQEETGLIVRPVEVVTVFDRRLKDTPVNPEQKSEAQDDDRDPQCAHR